MIARRSIIKGLVALVAAPAIVKVADLMPVNAKLWPGFDFSGLRQYDGVSLRGITEYVPGAQPAQLDVLYGSKSILPGDVVTFGSSNIDPTRQFVVTATEQDHLHVEYIADRDFYEGAQWNDQDEAFVRAHMPNTVSPAIPDNLALAAAAVAVAPLVLAKPVTRRFWAR